jgi:L-fuconolactonase
MAHRGLSGDREAILEPDLPIIDPHHHLWDRRARLTEQPPKEGRGSDAMLLLAPKFLDEDFVEDLAMGHRVVSTVFVECSSMYRTAGPVELKSLGETEFAAEIGSRYAHEPAELCAAIVGNVNLSLGDLARPILEAHIEAGQGRFRGIRDRAAWDADPQVRMHYAEAPQGLLADARFRTGFAHLAKLGLSFDAWLLEPQLKDLLQLAQDFPETRIVLDHVGAPLGVGAYAGRREERFPTWRESIDALAGCENVDIKLGCLGMALTGFDMFMAEPAATSTELAEAWRPYIETCIEAFGPSRCMFESNFPVDLGTAGYPVLWNTFKRLSSGASADQKRQLFHDTAKRVYRLDAVG